VPPSVETSTPATRPPLSAAVPETVICAPLAAVAPVAGEVMFTVGAAESVEAEAAERVAIRVVGCTPMSANRFRVACWIRTSTGAFSFRKLSW
jgi:hypothetical protein